MAVIPVLQPPRAVLVSMTGSGGFTFTLPAVDQRAFLLHRCKTLDASADGYVRAEAVGCAILMPAAAVPEAMQAGMVLLSGSAVNQDGRSSSLTAPNGPSQQGVIRQALQAGGVAGGEVAMVQMHGTGTPLGGME